MGIGSDLSGSIRIPSYCNGVFGFLTSPGIFITRVKLALDAVSLKGHIPSFKEGTYPSLMCRGGPLTRFAEDIPLFIQV